MESLPCDWLEGKLGVESLPCDWLEGKLDGESLPCDWLAADGPTNDVCAVGLVSSLSVNQGN